MEITFKEAEFIKQLCMQTVLGLDHAIKQSPEDLSTAMSFIGVPGATEERFKTMKEEMRETRRRANELIERINEEFGL